MEKSRKFVVSIGVLILFFIAWIAWITFKSPLNPETAEIQLPQGEMSQLRNDLSDFIKERLKSERPKSQLINVSIEMPLEENGKLRVPYVLSYRDGAEGIESSVKAIALLERSGALWKVTKVLPQKETITYEQNALVKSDSGPSSVDQKTSEAPQ